jgi:hypothetical protein
MSDTTPTDQGQTPDATSVTTPTDRRQTAMTVADAAQALGLTSDAIRARIRRGTMSGFKADDDTWRVIVDQPVDATPTDAGQTDGTTPTGRGQTATDLPTDADLRLIEHMQEEIMYLRTELAQRSHELATERERSDILQREALGRIEALTAGETVSGTAQEAPGSPLTNDTGPRGVWNRLRRWMGGDRGSHDA